MIKKLVIFSMVAVMAIASLYGCGSDSSDAPATTVTTTTTIPGTTAPKVYNVIAVAEDAKVTGTAAADQFNLAAPTGKKDRTISGFVYGTDLLAIPEGAELPSALPGTVNDATGATATSVDLTWASGAVIHMTDLNEVTRNALLSGIANTKAYGTFK